MNIEVLVIIVNTETRRRKNHPIWDTIPEGWEPEDLPSLVGFVDALTKCDPEGGVCLNLDDLKNLVAEKLVDCDSNWSDNFVEGIQRETDDKWLKGLAKIISRSRQGG